MLVTGSSVFASRETSKELPALDQSLRRALLDAFNSMHPEDQRILVGYVLHRAAKVAVEDAGLRLVFSSLNPAQRNIADDTSSEVQDVITLTRI
jgi:hypothetical protein